LLFVFVFDFDRRDYRFAMHCYLSQISRHAFALVSAAALASAITITTIIADSTA
jgi:hypothetical protein